MVYAIVSNPRTVESSKAKEKKAKIQVNRRAAFVCLCLYVKKNVLQYSYAFHHVISSVDFLVSLLIGYLTRIRCLFPPRLPFPFQREVVYDLLKEKVFLFLISGHEHDFSNNSICPHEKDGHI